MFLPGIDRPFSTPKFFSLAVFVCCGAIVGAIFRAVRRPNLPLGFTIAILAWTAATVVSALKGDFVAPQALWLCFGAVGWFVLLLGSRPNPLHLSTAISLSGAMVAGIALLQFAGIDPFRLIGLSPATYVNPRMRVVATLGNPNFVAAFLAACLPLTVTLVSRAKAYALFIGLAALQFAAILATGSKAGLLAVIVATLCFVCSGKVSVRWFAALLAVLLVMVTIGPSRGLRTTLEGRLYIWRISAHHLIDKPFFGFGPGAYAPQFVAWETAYWREGRGNDRQRQFAGLQEHAHNDYLEIALERGWAGLAGFLGVLGYFFVFTFKNAHGPQRELRLGAGCGVMALVFTAWVDFPFARPAATFVFWTLMALACLSVPPSGTQHTEISNEKARFSDRDTDTHLAE